MDFLSTLFIFLAGCIALLIIGVFIHDKFQSSNAVKRNYPVLAWLRPISERLGEFFRRYISFGDREAQPFSRATRKWVYEAADGNANIQGFGTKINFRDRIYYFKNAIFPINENEAELSPSIVLGPNCAFPYQPESFFNISAMSYGSLSAPAIEALSHGAEMAKCWLNTGEGGLAPHHLKGNPDIVFEIGTAKFGIRDTDGNFDPGAFITIAENPAVKMFELKLSQGAKPGKGGILPACKVTAEIAEIRKIEEGKDAVSPNRHKEIANIPELLDFINLLRDMSGKPVGFKTAIGNINWLEDLCHEINKRGNDTAPDFITIDGAEGGTGASPVTLMDNSAMSIFDALPAAVKILERHHLKKRMPIIASGKLITAGDVAWAIASGADFVVSARGFMFSIGCIMAMKCHTDKCPSGVATHDKKLQKALKPQEKKEKVKNYVVQIQKEVETIAHTCGVKHARLLNSNHLEILK